MKKTFLLLSILTSPLACANVSDLKLAVFLQGDAKKDVSFTVNKLDAYLNPKASSDIIVLAGYTYYLPFFLEDLNSVIQVSQGKTFVVEKGVNQIPWSCFILPETNQDTREYKAERVKLLRSLKLIKVATLEENNTAIARGNGKRFYTVLRAISEVPLGNFKTEEG